MTMPEEDSDFFFHDVSVTVEDSSAPDSDLLPPNGGVSAATGHQPSQSAPTLRKYTSRDSKSGFNTQTDVRSYLSLTPSLSHPMAVPSKRPHLVGVSDFFGANAPPNNIVFSELDDMQRVAIGRNSLIYKANYRAKPVAVKVMIPGLEMSAAVQAEFSLEQHVLFHCRHPNLVHMLGCGLVDPLSKPEGATQRFTVLEWLDRSLDHLSPAQPLSALHPKRVFAWHSSARSLPAVLPVLLQVSSVLRYLHGEVPFPPPSSSLSTSSSTSESTGNVTSGEHERQGESQGHLEIIHRAVVPEHFRYNGDSPQTGLKLTSFMACNLTFCPAPQSSIRAGGGRGGGAGGGGRLEWCAAPHHPTSALCYTAPEVALRLSISTKTDIYAFSLLAWQLMKSRKPYAGLSKKDFMSAVVYKGKRPKISRSWSESFGSLLEACWLNDPADRPPMHEVFDKLLSICHQISVVSKSQK